MTVLVKAPIVIIVITNVGLAHLSLLPLPERARPLSKNYFFRDGLGNELECDRIFFNCVLS